MAPGHMLQVEKCGRDRGKPVGTAARITNGSSSSGPAHPSTRPAWRASSRRWKEPGRSACPARARGAAAEMLYGLQQRTRSGTATEPGAVAAGRLGTAADGGRGHGRVAGGDHTQHGSSAAWPARGGGGVLDPETEVRKDVWDLAAFRLQGKLTFTPIRQRWLRETARRWAADDLPRRRGSRRRPVGPLPDQPGRAVREPGRCPRRPRGGPGGARPRGHRVVHAPAGVPHGPGRISADARTRACRKIRHLLRQFRALGLTRPGGTAAGLPDDFAVRDSDIPVKPDEPERPGPAAGIMRQLCDWLPALEDISCREIRAAAELRINTAGARRDARCRGAASN